MSDSSMTFASVAALSRDRTLILRARTSPTSEAKIMIPRPPSWIMSMIATRPTPLQCVAVSTTVRPVTHTAEVAVNRAS